jgi:ERCC4-type nuclease
MILVDSRVGSREMLPFIQRFSCPSQIAELQFGDACFEGNGPLGKISMGIERKALSDMLNCIDDSRYAAFQKPGMKAMYERSILVIEGVWKPDTSSGYLLECVAALSWRPYKYRMQMVRYSKLFRYLLTVQLTGVIVICTRNIEETSYIICEMYHYFQKKWDDHTSMLETQKLNIPELRGRPSLMRRWAAELSGVGVKLSMAAEKSFDSAYKLANADEVDWVRVPGISVKLAREIYEEIHAKDT